MAATIERGHEIKVLDDGFVRLVDFTGDDTRIASAARLTSGSRGADDRNLIRYLMRHRHDTPFEFCGVTVHIRIPMDAWRQFVRHRLFSINEYSTRYSPAIDSQQKTPADQWRLQAQNNRQGSDGFLCSWTGEGGKPNEANGNPEYRLDHAARITASMATAEPLSPGQALTILENDFHRSSRDLYEQRLAMGVAREQARKDLPLSTYTEAWVECDLRGWLHFLSLRMDSHAQKEIRDYANAIGQMIAELFPVAWEAFGDYRLDGLSLTRLDIEAANAMALSAVNGGDTIEAEVLAWHHACEQNGWPIVGQCRERDECRDKLKRIGLLSDDA